MNNRVPVPSLTEIAGTQDNSVNYKPCSKCSATHWITVAIAAQKKLDDLIHVNLSQMQEIGQLRRHITDLNFIIETRSLWLESERLH